MSYIDTPYFSIILDYCDLKLLFQYRNFFPLSYLQKRVNQTPFSIVTFGSYPKGNYDYPVLKCHLVIGQNKPKETNPNDIYDIKTIDPLFDIPSFENRWIWSLNHHPQLWDILCQIPKKRYVWFKYKYIDIGLMHRMLDDLHPTMKIPENMYTPVLLGIGTDDPTPWFQTGDSNRDGIICDVVKWGETIDDPSMYLDVLTLPRNFKVCVCVRKRIKLLVFFLNFLSLPTRNRGRKLFLLE